MVEVANDALIVPIAPHILKCQRGAGQANPVDFAMQPLLRLIIYLIHRELDA